MNHILPDKEIIMKSKRVLAVLTCLVMLFSYTSFAVFAQSPKLPTVSLSYAQTQPGDTFTVDVELISNPGIINLALNVEYDTSVFTLEKVTDTGLFSGAVHSPNYSNYPYYLTWNNDTALSDITVNGVIATLSFRVADNAQPGSYSIKLSYDNANFDIFNFNFETVDFDLEEADVEIVECLHKNVTEVSGTAATCTAAGLTAGFRCSDCGIWLTPQEEIPAKGHSPVKLNAKPATCTASGLTEGSCCSVCGETIVAQTSVKALGHDMSGTAVIKAATVTQTGILRTSCSRCDYYEDSVIPKLPAPAVSLGDVDNDNAITASDARLALRRAVKLETYAEGSAEFIACDVNKDGNVGADDARIILRIAVKLEKISDYNK